MTSVEGTFEKTSAEGVTPETGTITLSGVPEASWTDEYKIKLVINEGTAQFTIEEPVIVIEKKKFTADNIVIADKEGNLLIWDDTKYTANNNIDFTISFTNDVPEDCKIKKTEDNKPEVTCSNGANIWNSNGNTYGMNGSSYSADMTLTIITNYGTVTKLFFTQQAANKSGNGSDVGSRAGFFSGLISRITGASSESSYTPVETDKTRSITIPNWVTDDLNSSDVADKVNESSSAVIKKAAKKTKKAQKAAKSVKTPVEQPIASETVESVAVTSAATLGDVVETVTETAAEVITSADTTETSVIADTVEPSATMNLPVYSEPLAEEEINASDSRAFIWTFIALITAALVTAAAVLFARRRK